MTIKILTPVSHLFTQVSDTLQRIYDLSDGLELRDHSPAFKSQSLLIYHCELSLIAPWTEAEKLGMTKIIDDNKEISFVSFHLLSCFTKPVTNEAGMFYQGESRMTEEEMIDNARNNLAYLKSALPNRPLSLAIENNNYFPFPTYDIVTDPEFINKLLATFELELLLDIAHAIISAGNKKLAFADYLGKFDLTRVRQIHLSKHSIKGDLYVDSHLELVASDWDLFEEIKKDCPNLEFVTIEYYKDINILLSTSLILRNILSHD